MLSLEVIKSIERILSAKNELLTAAKELWQAFSEVFIKGLINFDSPVMSIIDYILWGGVIVKLLQRLFKFYRR